MTAIATSPVFTARFPRLNGQAPARGAGTAATALRFDSCGHQLATRTHDMACLGGTAVAAIAASAELLNGRSIAALPAVTAPPSRCNHIVVGRSAQRAGATTIPAIAACLAGRRCINAVRAIGADHTGVRIGLRDRKRQDEG
jgi:hypothetical protein